MKKFLNFVIIILLLIACVGTGIYFGYYYKNDNTQDVEQNQDIGQNQDDDNLESNINVKIDLPEKFDEAVALVSYKVNDNKIVLTDSGVSSSKGLTGLYSYDLASGELVTITDSYADYEILYTLSNGDKYLSNTGSFDDNGIFFKYDYANDNFVKIAELKVGYMNEIDDNTFALSSLYSTSGSFLGFKFLDLTTNEITTPDIDNMTGMGYDIWFNIDNNKFLIFSANIAYTNPHIYDRSTNELLEISGDFPTVLKSCVKLSNSEFLLVYPTKLLILDISDNSVTTVETSYKYFGVTEKVADDIVLIGSNSAGQGIYTYTISSNTVSQLTLFSRNYDSIVNNEDGTYTISSSSNNTEVVYDVVQNKIIKYFYEI